jgi:glutathione S-transferase
MLSLIGTTTSPFVRRVRVVALEKGVDLTLIPALTDEGQAALRRASPVWKVPVALFDDGRTVYDSRVIIDELCHDGWGPLRAPSTDPRTRVAEENIVTMIDEALASLIRRFYLQRDGAQLATPYLDKDLDRAHTILRHLDASVVDVFATGAGRDAGGFGRAELALVTALDWFVFRKTFDVAQTPRLEALRAHWQTRPSIAQTAPTP